MSFTVDLAAFLKEVADHKLTIIRDDGLYRHLRYANPKTSIMSFSIITWPGYLAYVGDMGDYVFARLPDMFNFFRGETINCSYWAEKVQASCRDGVTQYSEEVARAWVKEYTEGRTISPDAQSYIEDLTYDEGEAELRRQLENIDGHFHDAWEADFSEYTGRYLWCCYAIVWVIKQYDLQRQPEPQQWSEAQS